jgi:hypothetical protein
VRGLFAAAPARTSSAAPHLPQTGCRCAAAPSSTRFFAPQFEHVATAIVFNPHIVMKDLGLIPIIINLLVNFYCSSTAHQLEQLAGGGGDAYVPVFMVADGHHVLTAYNLG